MKPVTFSVVLAAADDDGVALNQTPGAAGDLTLNGTLVSGGVGILATSGARQVLVTTAANESAKTLTIYGMSAGNFEISETITGPNATTGTTAQHFRTITRVAVSAAFTGNVKVGTNGVGSSVWKVPDHYVSPFEMSFLCAVSGTVDYTLQLTNEDVRSGTPNPTWYAHATLAADTSTQAGTQTAPISAYRVLVNSGTGTVTTTAVQSGI